MKALLAAGALLWLTVRLSALTGVVSADNLNVRTGPGTEHPVIAVLAAGEQLNILGVEGKWLQIPLPEKASVWTSSIFVSENSELLPGAVLRCGPGVSYDAYRYKPSPKHVLEILRFQKDGRWVEIRAPAGLKCYVNKAFLRLDDGKSLRNEEGQPFIRSDERAISMEGTLVRLRENDSLASHRLILEINGDCYTVCKLYTKYLNFSLWEGRKVRVEGFQRWRKDNSMPYVEVEKISPSW